MCRVSTALINTNIKGKGLLHSINVCGATALIVGRVHTASCVVAVLLAALKAFMCVCAVLGLWWCGGGG
jgi:hypothetical protein